MRDRTEQMLRGACLVLAVLVLVSVVKSGCRAFALVGAKIPPVPVLETNSVAGANSTPVKNGTNASAAKNPSTNSPVTAAGTNSTANAAKNVTKISNDPVPVPTNQLSTNHNLEVADDPGARKISPRKDLKLSERGGTNVFTNAAARKILDANLAGTNPPLKKSRSEMPPGMMRGMPGGGFPGMPGKPAPLPPEIQARVEKIVESELFAPVVHPQPMTLLGIAGETVFLQTPSGQTGLLTVTNEPMDGIKLLRIGINRVLVEQDGQNKELMIFDGYGGESLLPKENSK